MNITIPNHRLLSLDVLRGITIAFMIIVNNPGSWSHVYPMLEHAKWNGCTPTDLVFPFFVTIIGITMAIAGKTDGNSSQNIYLIFKRSAIIFIIGLLLNYFPFFNKELSQLRILGVLQRIAMAYLLAGSLLALVYEKYHLLTGIVLFITYYLFLRTSLPFPPTLESNAPNNLDLLILGPNHIYKGYGIPFDPEGFAGTLGTSINVVFGYIVGKKIKLEKDQFSKFKTALLYGLILIILGLLFSLHLPLNKPIWTPTYAIFTSGICLLLFGILIYVVDYLNYQKFFSFFKIYGMNALAMFVLSGIIVKTLNLFKWDDANMLGHAYSSFFQPVFGDDLGSFIQAIVFCFAVWLVALMMYRKKIFWRV